LERGVNNHLLPTENSPPLKLENEKRKTKEKAKGKAKEEQYLLERGTPAAMVLVLPLINPFIYMIKRSFFFASGVNLLLGPILPLSVYR
jgi:hypothetical protein